MRQYTSGVLDVLIGSNQSLKERYTGKECSSFGSEVNTERKREPWRYNTERYCTVLYSRGGPHCVTKKSLAEISEKHEEDDNDENVRTTWLAGFAHVREAERTHEDPLEPEDLNTKNYKEQEEAYTDW